MSEPDQTGVRRRFLLHGLIALVTLGLYMPVCLAWRDQEVRQRAEVTTGVPSGWALGAGAALGVISRAVLGGGSSGAAAGLSVVYLRVHWIGDVVGGMLAAWLALTLADQAASREGARGGVVRWLDRQGHRGSLRVLHRPGPGD